METHQYNPSPFETEIIESLKEKMGSLLQGFSGGEVVLSEVHLQDDNPFIVFRTRDKDGDLHEFSLRVIQKPDSSVF